MSNSNLLTQPGWQTSCFMSLLTFAFTLYNQLAPYHRRRPIDAGELESKYDFIIIGGGSAGAVVANRLSEVKKWKILLLEAGGPETPMADVPYLASDQQKTKLDWAFRTEPPKGNQSYCLSSTNHSCAWPRGKALGGSSVINSMFYIRGNKHDYDDWERMGNTGWGYNNVLKYFKKSEDNSNPYLAQTRFHSTGGYQSVEDARYPTPLVGVFLKAGEYLGYATRDCNGANQTGFMYTQGTTRNGSRWSTATGFILPVQERPNLSVSMYSHVKKIGFEKGIGIGMGLPYVMQYESTVRARSVSFDKNGKTYTVKAKKEIIVSGGAINSPQILMLSGIGPEDHLKDLGIKVVKNLKVGYNLQDHLEGYLAVKIDKPITLKPAEAENPDAAFKYLTMGEGPLTSLVINVGLAFVNTKYANPSGSQPDIEFVFIASSIYDNGAKPIGVLTNNFRPDLFNGSPLNNLDNVYLCSIATGLLHPKSRGRISLRSADPYEYPIIEPNYLTEKEDVEVTVAGMRLALDMFKTPPFKVLNATPLEIPFPGCEKYELYSDEYLECIPRHYTRTGYHPSCTCPMGVGPDSVVDPRLRVHGVYGLRVIDASIMPKVVSGNTNAPSIMIGEYGSDIIKQDWKACSKADDLCLQRQPT